MKQVILQSRYHYWTTNKDINPNYLKAEFAVRGLVPQTALLIQDQINQGVKFPFDALTDLSNGNPQIFGQKPISFYRNVLSAMLDTSISKYQSDDVQRRVKFYTDHMRQPLGAYSHSLGFEFARETVAKFIQKRDGIPYRPSIKNIILTDGACGGITLLFSLLLKGNQDGVMLPIPQYPLYSALITQCGASIVPYHLNEERTWQTNISELDSQYQKAKSQGVTPKILVCINPGNPTGQVFEEETIIDMIKFAAAKKLIIFADEVYQDNIYAENKKFVSFRKIASKLDLDLEIYSFHSISKGIIGECGFRGGYFEITSKIDKEVYEQICKTKSKIAFYLAISLCSNTIGQILTDLAFNPPCQEEGCTDSTIQQYQVECRDLFSSLKKRAKIVTAALNEVKGVSCQPTEGAMYAFPKIHLSNKFIQHSRQLGYEPDQAYCLDLLKETGLVVVPGSGFLQEEGTYHFRMTTLILPEDRLVTKMKVFKEWHEKYMRKMM